MTVSQKKIDAAKELYYLIIDQPDFEIKRDSFRKRFKICVTGFVSRENIEDFWLDLARNSHEQADSNTVDGSKQQLEAIISAVKKGKPYNTELVTFLKRINTTDIVKYWRELNELRASFSLPVRWNGVVQDLVFGYKTFDDVTVKPSRRITLPISYRLELKSSMPGQYDELHIVIDKSTRRDDLTLETAWEAYIKPLQNELTEYAKEANKTDDFLELKHKIIQLKKNNKTYKEIAETLSDELNRNYEEMFIKEKADSYAKKLKKLRTN